MSSGDCKKGSNLVCCLLLTNYQKEFMKLIILIFSFFCIVPLSASENDYLNKPIKWANSEGFENYWTLSNQLGSEKENIQDWVPLDDSKSAQAFTVQTYLLDEPFEVSAVVDKFISTLKENIEPTDLLNYEMISEESNAVFFEWWVSPPYLDAQHEWVKIMKGSDNVLAIVRYDSQLVPRSDAEDQWIRCVETADFESLTMAE